MKLQSLRSKKSILTSIGIILAILGWVFVWNFIMNNFTSEGSNSKACGKLLTDTILSVKGVESTSVHCSLQFGGGWKRVEVKLAASTQAEAYVIVDSILKAYAYQKDIPGTWSTPQVYVLNDGTTLKSLPDYNGVPDAADVRKHLNIQP